MDYCRAWCDLSRSPSWLREWADDVLDAEEERETLDYLRRHRMPRWYIEEVEWVWTHPVE